MTHLIPDTMRAAAIDHFGGIENIHVRTLPVPEPGPDEVLIHVESAGVAVWDAAEREGELAKMMEGKPHFPYVLGSDGAGTVVTVGRKVTRFKEGDRVYAGSFLNPKGGFYAEYAAAKADLTSHIPDKIPTDQAGAMFFDAITALRGLDDVLGLKSGESVMIFGASGGLGHLAVQLARRMGARVFAVASGDDGVALVRQLGADEAVDGHKNDVVAAARRFAPDGLDAALITAGGKETDRALTALRDGGRVAYPNGVDPEPTARPGIKVHAYDGDPDRQIIDKLNRLIEAGPLEVHIDHTFPLDQAAETHRALQKHFLGKLALRPGEVTRA